MGSDPKPYWTWQRSAAVAILAVGALQFYRANKPRREAAPSHAIEFYTSGMIVDAPVNVAAHDFVSYPIHLNRKADLVGQFRVASKKGNVEALVFDAVNFERWKADGNGTRIVSTKEVPGGKIARSLGPGSYYLVISNRSSDAEKTVQAQFGVE